MFPIPARFGIPWLYVGLQRWNLFFVDPWQETDTKNILIVSMLFIHIGK